MHNKIIFHAIYITAFLALSSSMAGCEDSAPKPRDPCKYESSGKPLNISEEACEIMRTKEFASEQRGAVIAADAGFKSGGKEVLRIALKIATHELLEQAELKALGPGIDQSYPHEFPDVHGSTFLYQALRSENLQAVEALLQAGASPYAPIDPKHRQFKFRNYISMVLTDPWVVSGGLGRDREDRSFPNTALKLYFKYGGDPDYPGLFGDSPLLGETMEDIGAFTMLLDYGANPWFMTSWDEPYPVLLFGSGSDSAINKVRILLSRGYYDNIKTDDINVILRKIERKLENADLRNLSRGDQFYEFEMRYFEMARRLIDRTGYNISPDTRLHYLLYERQFQ